MVKNKHIQEWDGVEHMNYEHVFYIMTQYYSNMQYKCVPFFYISFHMYQ